MTMKTLSLWVDWFRKSTLISLIPNMYDPTDGEVLVNGREVREWPTQDLRQTIGYVPQSAVLFTGSIYDNLLWEI